MVNKTPFIILLLCSTGPPTGLVAQERQTTECDRCEVRKDVAMATGEVMATSFPSLTKGN